MSFFARRIVLAWPERIANWRSSCLFNLFFWFGAIVIASNGAYNASADELGNRLAYWETQALLCEASPGGIRFPSKQTDDSAQPCNDGDMTLFNGLLCAAGDQRGCLGVAEAQDPTSGEWFRSPRIRIHGNDRGGADFSPDMAMGVQLYLVKTGDTARAMKWLNWMEDQVPCEVHGAQGQCALKSPIPQFCTDDKYGCLMRPGDAAQLANTVNWLQHNKGMGDLQNGSLRGYLGTFSEYSEILTKISADWNKPGYSQHLVGVGLLLLHETGINDAVLTKAARTIQGKNIGNAFFSYLAEGWTAKVEQEILARCPAVGHPTETPRDQWQWERENADSAWLHSAYWDCIFMVHLKPQQ
jgi:hypothetical protein